MPITLGIASAALSVASAAQANKNAKDVASYQNAQQRGAYAKAVAVNAAQGAVTATEKRRQIQNRYDAYRGATITSAAERGMAFSQSTTSLMSSLGIQASRESAKTTMEQLLNQQAFAVSNMPQWQVSQSTSPFLAGIQGGLQGISMGYGLMASQSQLDTSRMLSSINSSGLSTTASNP